MYCVNMSPSSLYRSKIAIFLFFLQIAAILVCAGCLLDYVTARHFANKLPVRVLQDGKRPARPIRRHCSTSAAGRESHHSGLFRNFSFAQASQFSAVQEEQ